MSNQTLQNLGDAIFGDIDNNPFLNELYDDILYNYAITKFNLTDKRQMREIDVVSALRFADLLSKSTHAMNRDKHKMWAQEIIILLYSLYPDNPDVKFYAGSVFANTGNYQARRIIDSDFYGTTALERFFAEYQNDYLTIPAAPELRFFGAQKNAYDHLSDDHFSYSGPTSMGKSFLMRMYIKDQIQHGVKMNFALIVPTKALINEIYKQVIDEDLKNLLSERNYKVVTAAGDIALEGKHNFILVLTPERLLYLLISKPDLQIDYLFIDEAHKLSGKNSRGPFYYKTVDMLLKRKKKPHFVFASPNIPNPEVYLKLLTDIETDGDDSHLCSTFLPVAQIKFSIDLNNFTVSVYNDHSNIMKKALEYRQQHRDNFWVNRGQKEYYDDGLRHRNIVFADTLEVIDNIVLFSISNYFLRFSNEYKTVHQLKEFDNNWYEFVEYGTTNPITILLQRNGFSREVSTYIRNNKEEFIIEEPDGKWHLSTALLECSNTNARTEASSVRYNMPELFIAESGNV